MFEKKGLVIIDPVKSKKTFDELFEVALEGGAEDVREVEGDDGPEWEVRPHDETPA
jgi:transcriptional/translational regulatory protein YebC/TACO1